MRPRSKFIPNLFVYGTLRPGHAPAEIAAVVSSLEPVGKGSLRGTRYDLGDYPAILTDRSKPGKVHGEVLKLPDDPQALASLDAYEEFDPKHPDKSLFRRTKAVVTLSDGRRAVCWVYLYNRPMPRVKIMLQDRLHHRR